MKTLTLALVHLSFLTLVALLTVGTSQSITQDYPVDYVPTGYEKPLFTENEQEASILPVDLREDTTARIIMPVSPDDETLVEEPYFEGAYNE